MIGPATAILICAFAAPENARAAASATPDNQCLVIQLTPISFQTPGPPLRPSAEGNSTLKADTFLFSVKSHLKKHKGLSDQRRSFSHFLSRASSIPNFHKSRNIGSPSSVARMAR